jgi:phosphoglycolate phosphatase-like HAD superfamily hydrolase
MIGDQFSDVFAARAAGFRAAVLLGSRPSAELGTEDFVVHSLKGYHHFHKRLKAFEVDYFGSHLDSLPSAGE